MTTESLTCDVLIQSSPTDEAAANNSQPRVRQPVQVLRERCRAYDINPEHGYGPALCLEFAKSYRFMKLSVFMSLLRNMNDVQFSDRFSVDSAWSTLIEVKRCTPPFSDNHRFPASDIYVCLDKAPILCLLSTLHCILATPLESIDVHLINEYFNTITSLFSEVSLENNSSAVFYRRDSFEQTFDLNWIP
ncbi:hypothetical protein FRX31_019059 [Thalictrum thalictroides]|uniref:Uncharacterized protein n=1 Tax=Thalictrum thalictroides TaxID=46969 RepID=A0A7J6W1W1_THATH|nr:hypothetical protein FRX31_019059 [Thalictrum thalictroides]